MGSSSPCSGLAGGPEAESFFSTPRAQTRAVGWWQGPLASTPGGFHQAAARHGVDEFDMVRRAGVLGAMDAIDGSNCRSTSSVSWAYDEHALGHRGQAG